YISLKIRKIVEQRGAMLIFSFVSFITYKSSETICCDKEYEVAVYTHADTNHIHNHIEIGSINLEDGKNYQSNAAQRHLVKDINDDICHRYGLSVVKEKSAGGRHTLAEQELFKKGEINRLG